LREFFWEETMQGVVICATSRVQMRNKWWKGAGIAGAEPGEAGARRQGDEISAQVEGDREEQARRSRPGLLRKLERVKGTGG